MKVNVNILTGDDGDFDDTVAAVRAEGADISAALARIGVIRATVDDAQIPAVASLAGVQAVERESSVRAS